MDEKTVKEELVKAGAVLEGHFRLSSGLHSSTYVQCALALAHPLLAERLGEALAEKMGYPLADVVLGPALGGVVIAQELARALSKHHKCEVLSYFSERKDVAMELRRGFMLHPGQKVILVEDVVTTGKSISGVGGVGEAGGGGDNRLGQHSEPQRRGSSSPRRRWFHCSCCKSPTMSRKPARSVSRAWNLLSRGADRRRNRHAP